MKSASEIKKSACADWKSSIFFLNPLLRVELFDMELFRSEKTSLAIVDEQTLHD